MSARHLLKRWTATMKMLKSYSFVYTPTGVHNFHMYPILHRLN